MKVQQFTQQFRTRGISMMELLIWLAVFAGVAVFVSSQATNLFGGATVERAYAEIEKVKTAAETYRRSLVQAGLYTNISITRLATRGYNVDPLTTGTNQNTYGLTVAIASAAANTDATLTYELGNVPDCTQMIDRFTGMPGIKTAPACSAAGLLTMTLE